MVFVALISRVAARIRNSEPRKTVRANIRVFQIFSIFLRVYSSSARLPPSVFPVGSRVVLDVLAENCGRSFFFLFRLDDGSATGARSRLNAFTETTPSGRRTVLSGVRRRRHEQQLRDDGRGRGENGERGAQDGRSEERTVQQRQRTAHPGTEDQLSVVCARRRLFGTAVSILPLPQERFFLRHPSKPTPG